MASVGAHPVRSHSECWLCLHLEERLALLQHGVAYLGRQLRLQVAGTAAEAVQVRALPVAALQDALGAAEVTRIIGRSTRRGSAAVGGLLLAARQLAEHVGGARARAVAGRVGAAAQLAH